MLFKLDEKGIRHNHRNQAEHVEVGPLRYSHNNQTTNQSCQQKMFARDCPIKQWSWNVRFDSRVDCGGSEIAQADFQSETHLIAISLSGLEERMNDRIEALKLTTV
jgi:hypothetical protein